MTVAMIRTNISDYVNGFELTFMLVRGFVAPIRDFTELNLICYMLRVQEDKRSQNENGAGE